MFNNCNRVLILRLDLGYTEQIHDLNKVEVLVNDFDHLIANRRTNHLFSHRLGFVALLSYTPAFGFHWRTIFFFDGQQRIGINHADLSRNLGLYWSKLRRPSPRQGNFKSYNKLWPESKKGISSKHLVLPGFGPLMGSSLDCQQKFVRDILYPFCMAREFFKLDLPGNIRQIRKGR